MFVKYISCRDFNLSYWEDQLAQSREQRLRSNVAIRVVLLALAVMAVSVMTLPVFVLCVFSAIVCLRHLHRIETYLLRDPHDVHWRIRQAKRLNERKVIYDDRRPTWQFGSNMFPVIDKWCTQNGIRCEIADISDAMFGYSGMIISFDNDADMVLFKLKWS